MSSSKSFAKFREEMEKEYGKELQRVEFEKPYEVISTGIPSLDWATGVGGLVRGKISLYWGAEAMGKSTAAYLAIAEAQHRFPDEQVALIDVEKSYNPHWGAKLGVNTHPDKFMRWKPKNTERASDQLRKCLLQGGFSLIVVDSVGGMLHSKEFEIDATGSNMGKNAQVITRMSNMAQSLADDSNTAVLLISQVRVVMGQAVSYDTFAGPKGLRHSVSQRFKFSKTQTPEIIEKLGKGGDLVVGREYKAKMERSKVASVEGRTGTFFIISEETEKNGPVGVDKTDQVRALTDLLGLLPKRGSWYDLPDGTSVNGGPAYREWLQANPNHLENIRQMAIETQNSLIIPDTEVKFVEVEEEDEG